MGRCVNDGSVFVVQVATEAAPARLTLDTPDQHETGRHHGAGGPRPRLAGCLHSC
jgi:hypothetical protein